MLWGIGDEKVVVFVLYKYKQKQGIFMDCSPLGAHQLYYTECLGIGYTYIVSKYLIKQNIAVFKRIYKGLE